ncbi:MAG: response regulator [Saprospiraceae bacterium]|nr:response regulator [Saprospiraceae bacterium]
MKKTLLIVVRHENMRRLIGASLSDEFKVSGAQTALEAMALLKKGLLPDVILAESRATFSNGDHLLENLRCSGIYQDIPLLIFCDDDMPGEADRFRRLGASYCLTKPFNPIILQQNMLRLVTSMTSEPAF